MKPYIHQSFWSDPDIENLTPEQKLTVLWIFTNPQMTVCGFFQCSNRRYQFETGLEARHLKETLKALPRAFKYLPEIDIIYSRKFIRHQMGAGAQLVKNNIFKSVLSVFQGIKHEALRKMIEEDYPEIAEHSRGFVDHGARDHVVAAGLRMAILRRDGFTCLFSEEVLPEKELAVDHIMPRAKGGKTIASNLVAVSKIINSEKGDKGIAEFCEAKGYDFQIIAARARERASKPLEGERERQVKGKEGGLGEAPTDDLPMTLAGLDSDAALGLLKQQFPDRDVWGEWLRFKQVRKDQGRKPDWRGLVSWLCKAAPVADLGKKKPVAGAAAPLPNPELWPDYIAEFPAFKDWRFSELAAAEQEAFHEWAFPKLREAFEKTRKEKQ